VSLEELSGGSSRAEQQPGGDAGGGLRRLGEGGEGATTILAWARTTRIVDPEKYAGVCIEWLNANTVNGSGGVTDSSSGVMTRIAPFGGYLGLVVRPRPLDG